MHKPVVLFLLLFCSLICFGQKSLLFYNTKTLRTIELKVGHKATLLYKGYLNQTEVICHTVTDITDSTIVIGSDLSIILPEKRPGQKLGQVQKVIRISDITGFRRMTIGRQLAKAGVGVAGAVGSFYLLQYIYQSDISRGNAFLISLGTGFSLIGLNRILFPENIKYYFEDGWQVKVINHNR
jgi:hypothetical protein